MARALLYVFTAFAIGRIHELFPMLEPLRIPFFIGWAGVVATLLTSPAGRQPVLVQREVRIVLGIAALAVLLIPFSVWMTGSLIFLVKIYSKLVIFFLLVVALATDYRVFRNLVWTVLVSVGLLGIFALMGTAGVPVQEYGIVRAYAGTSYDPNDVAMLMVLTLPFAALGAAALRGAGRIVAGAVAVICLLATIATVSRGGFMGLAFVAILFLLRIRSAGGRLLAIAAIVAVVALAAPASYWDIMTTIWKPGGTGYLERGISPRLEIWGRGVNLLVEDPLTGVGIGMYEFASGLAYDRGGGWVTAHNSLLQFAVEMGLIGFALFVALLVLSIRNARRVARAAQEDPRLHQLAWIAAAVEISLLTYLVVGSALSQAYSGMLYFLIGVATALRAVVEQQQRIPAVVDFGWDRSREPIRASG